MDAIFRKEGQSLDYTPVSAVSAGDVIALQNNFYGIAKLDIAANELGSLAVTGIYQVAKPAGVPIIGMGGIQYARDAIEFLLAGATGLAIGTALFVDPRCIVDIKQGIDEYLTRQGKGSISDIIGTLECQ